MALLIVDLNVTSHGALTLGGLVSLVLGLVTLFHNAPPPYNVSVPLVASIAGAIGAFWAFALGKAWQARRSPVIMTPDRMVGTIGELRDGGFVFVDGELWRARSDDPSLRPGDPVLIEARDGLVLSVRPAREPAQVT